jgi:protein ImuB
MYAGLHSAAAPSPQTLLELGRRYTPRVEEAGGGSVLLDLRGAGRTWPSQEGLGRALLDAAGAAGVTVCGVALASSRVAALVLARARGGLTVVPRGEEAAFLAPLPLSALDLSPERQELFRRWGMRTLGDLAALPAAGLAERLGPEGARLLRLARGEDDAPLVASPSPERFDCALDLEWPVDGLEPLSFLLGRILGPLCDGLVARGRRAAALALDLALVDGTVHRRVLKPAAPTAAARTLRTLLLLDLEAHPPRDAIRALALRAEPTPSRTVQFSLLDPAQPSPERLAETMARLHEWTGAGRGGAASLLDTHRPGAFVMATFAPGPIGERGSRAGPPPRRIGEPTRLALRAFRPPLAARVVLRDHVPVFVAASGLRATVTDRAGPWRASGDWWDAAWSREEWDVELSGGAGVYRIFRDGIRGLWFVEGELD